MSRNVCTQDVGCRIGSAGKAQCWPIARGVRFQPTAFCQAGHEAIKDVPHWFCDPKRIAAELLSSGYRCHFPDAKGQLNGCQLICGEHRLLEGSLASGRNHLIVCLLGCVAQTRERDRFGLRTVKLVLGSFPSQMVKHVSIHRLGSSPVPSPDRHRSKSIYQYTRPPTIIEQLNPTLDVLTAAMVDHRSYPTRFARGVKEEDFRETNR